MPEKDRRPFLARACADDPELQAQVEAFLTRGQQAPSNFLNEPAAGARIIPRAGAIELASPTDSVPEVPAGITPSSPGVDAVLREPSSPGPHVTGYQILSQLGRGGMGVVYKARHGWLDRTVALKMILSGEHASPAEQARFLTEAQAIAQLQHPNIVQ